MATPSPATLFLAFLRLGATAFGGPAMLAHLRAELVVRRRWLSEQDFTEGVALCQVIPGATMVQMSTYAGHRLLGTPGALLAALGFVLPAFLLMTGLSAAYVHWGTLPAVQRLFRGLGAVVVAIVAAACVRLGRASLRGWQGVALAALALGALGLRVSFLLVLAGAAALAVPLYRRGRAVAPGPGSRET